MEHVPKEYNQEADALCKSKLQEYIRCKKETANALEVYAYTL